MAPAALAQPAHPVIPGDVTRYTLRALLDEARLLMGQEQALQYRLAAVLRELDQRAHADGSPMRLPRWLHDHFGLTFGTAREKVRTARALGSLPSIDTAFRDGQLSYSKVRALTRVATAENEEELLAVARQTSAEGVEHLVRRVKQSECLGDVQAMIRSRSLSTRWDESGALIVQGRLTPEQGEVLLKALAKATEALATATGHASEPDADNDSYWARRSDALTQVMADSLGGRQSSAPGDRHQVVVHVAAETLADALPDAFPESLPETSADTEQHVAKNVPAGTVSSNLPSGTREVRQQNVPAGTLLHPETIRRLACDGGLVTILDDPHGEPLNVGRKTRAIPPSTRRALVSRDRHCRFPGCSQDRFVEGHHIVHWAQGGETKLSNLVLLCSRHHRTVHEMGYRLRCATADHGLGNRTSNRNNNDNDNDNDNDKGTAIEFVKPGTGQVF